MQVGPNFANMDKTPNCTNWLMVHCYNAKLKKKLINKKKYTLANYAILYESFMKKTSK